MVMAKPLTGEDAAVLAVLAQAQALDAGQRKKLVDRLQGEARSIGKALTGGPSSQDAKKAAQAFQE